MTSVAVDKRPPEALIRILNPVMRAILRTPLGRIVRPFALLDFHGRRSGRRFRIPVGWHNLDGTPVVLTPAAWRANFADSLPVVVRHRGRKEHMTATLVTDPHEIAAAIRALIESGDAARNMGIDIPEDHAFTAQDVIAVNRALLRFTPA